MVRSIPREAIEFLIRAEALKTHAYQDSKGVWTIGVGHTGPEVVKGLVWTVDQCMKALVQDAEVHYRLLRKMVKPEIIEKLSEHQLAALISFVFNLGANSKWTIWKVLNRGAFDQVPAQIKRFDKIKLKNGTTKTLPGLTKRRAAEVLLYETPDVDHPEVAFETATPLVSAEHIPSSAIRRESTPPTPQPVKPLVDSKSFMTTGATGLAAIGTAISAWGSALVDSGSKAVKAVLDVVSPFGYSSEAVASAAAGLATVAAVLAVLALFFQWLKQRNARQ